MPGWQRRRRNHGRLEIATSNAPVGPTPLFPERREGADGESVINGDKPNLCGRVGA